MPYNDVFGGGVVQPADVSYRAVALTADVTLVWPTLSSTSTSTMARILGVTPTGAYAITFPDARQVSNGQDVLVRNLGASTITIKDSTGSTITTVLTGVSKYIYLVDNATAAGSWANVTFGTGSSTADAASLVGYGIKAIGVTLNQKHDVTELAANRTIIDSDRAAMYSFTTGSWTMTLPAAGTVGADFFFIAKNAGDGSITVTPSGADTIDGAASLTMAPGDACIFFSAGTVNDKWYTVGLGRAVSFAFTQLSKSVAGGVDVTLTSSEAANKVMSFTGILTANINVIVPSTVSVYYIANNTTGAFTLTVKTAAGTGVVVAQSTRDILVCDATNVYSAKSNTVSVQYFADGSESLPSISFISDVDTGFYRVGANQLAVTAGATDVMRWNTAASAVNAIDVFPAATGAAPYLKPFGGDANVDLEFRPLGEAGIVFTGGTVTTSNPIIDATQTWNAGGVTFTGWKLNVTSTASAAASLLLDLQVGGASMLSTTKAGLLTTAAGVTTTVLTATADSTFSSTGAIMVSKGTTAERPAAVVGKVRYNTTTSEFEGYSGAVPAWAPLGGSTLSDDTTTASNYYPTFVTAISGTATTLKVSSTKLLYKPSTGELKALELVATNAIVVTSNSVSENYTIEAGNSAMSVGPTVTVASGKTVTVSSGCRWIVLG